MDYRKLPRWRGFNLLEKFTLQNDKPYSEWDFDFLAKWGFDFVRLPTDYRIWTEAPGQYREADLKEIDQAVKLGKDRKIHVNLSLHRAPGYCVNRHPPETLDLWGEGSESDEARRQFAEQWRMLAERYRGIASNDLSFNLVNEPAGISGVQYLRAAKLAVQAIREVDAQRLIIADGTNYGRTVVPELVELRIAQSTRGYDPFQLTHHRASWVEGSDQWPLPVWPMPTTISQYLYGSSKPDLRSALVLHGEFPPDAEFSMTVHGVSDKARLVVSADGVQVWAKQYQPKSGKGEWKESVFKKEWKIFQAVYDRAYKAKLPANVRELRIEVTEGDWLSFSELTIKSAKGGTVRIVPNDADWGARQREYTVTSESQVVPDGYNAGYDGRKLYEEHVAPWVAFAAASRVGIHVGEWGAHSYTPHDVVLSWMKDCLANWKRAGIGWALWNLRGSFGCLDSERADVKYEDYEGHKLDRQMLELLTSDQ